MGWGERFMAASRRGSFVPGQRLGWRGLPGEVGPRVALTKGCWTSPGSESGFVWETGTLYFSPLFFRVSPRTGRSQGLGSQQLCFSFAVTPPTNLQKSLLESGTFSGLHMARNVVVEDLKYFFLQHRESLEITILLYNGFVL